MLCWGQVIAKAKVPIIKFKEAKSGFDFDISFEVADGPAAGEFVAQLLAQLPPMRPLILVLKIFLQQREFNEVRLATLSMNPKLLPEVLGPPRWRLLSAPGMRSKLGMIVAAADKACCSAQAARLQALLHRCRSQLQASSGCRQLQCLIWSSAASSVLRVAASAQNWLWQLMPSIAAICCLRQNRAGRCVRTSSMCLCAAWRAQRHAGLMLPCMCWFDDITDSM